MEIKTNDFKVPLQICGKTQIEMFLERYERLNNYDTLLHKRYVYKG